MTAVETKILNPNGIATAAATNSDIKNTTVVYDDSDATNPILKTNPTPETEPDPTIESEPDYEHEYNDDDDDADDEDYDDDNKEAEEVEPPEEDAQYPILIESDNKDSNDKEVISE